ncbi:MAG: hypothetical protein ACLVKR_07530 [Lachnospiraceae bacterium]
MVKQKQEAIHNLFDFYPKVKGMYYSLNQLLQPKEQMKLEKIMLAISDKLK